jgi:tetratricopeptide (TPR) repeat protein
LRKRENFIMPLKANEFDTHPVADHVERLIRSGNADEAGSALKAALKAEPHHPDLLAAEGFLFAFSGEEDRAIEDLGKAGFVPRARRLAKLLTEHLSCRQQLATKISRPDTVANTFLSKVRLAAEGAAEPIGIKVSACLIVKDEEKNLARCLKSLKGVVDEIVVVDTGSTDKTVEIAESFGAKVGHFPWNQDFAAARNHSLELATGDWALWIDADEELTADSLKAIQRAVVRPHFGGFAIEIINFTEDGSEAAQYVHKPIRLFRRVEGVRFSGRIHEQVSPSLNALDLPWAYLPGARLLHYGYRPTEMAERGKVERTVDMIRRELEDKPEDPFQWFNLANAYTAANDFPNVEKAAAECARFVAPGDQLGALNYQLWSNALVKQSRSAEAIRVCDEADRYGFGGILNEFERANAFLTLGLVDEGLEAANRCLALDWPKDMTGDVTIAEYKRFIVRGQLLALKLEFTEAVAMFDRAIRVNRQYGPAIYSRAATLEKSGKLEQALEGFLSGQENPQVGQLCLKGAARVCERLGLPKRASELYRDAWCRDAEDHEAWVGWVQAAEAYGDLPVIVEAYTVFAERNKPSADMLINWGRALDAMGEFDRALLCYQEAIDREPANPNAYFNCGDLLYKLESFEQAAEIYQTGLQLQPQNASGWFVLGNALARLGVTHGARVSYQQALAIRPDYAEARHNLDVICQAA